MKFKLIKKLFISLIVALTINTSVYSEEEHEHRHHEAHVHGEAELSFLIDGEAIVFELKSPALNVLGFEHEPKNSKEKEAVKEASKKLSSYENIISIPGLNCKVTEFNIESPYEAEHEEDHHHNHEHHHKEHHDDEEHGDYYLSYSLNCENINKLETIEVKLFEHFNGFENIEAMWINQNNSGSSELTSEQKIIKIK